MTLQTNSTFAPLRCSDGIIALAEQAGRPDSPVHRALGEQLADGAALADAAVNRMIAQFANGWTRAAVLGAVTVARRCGASAAVPHVAVIAPANVPAAGWQAVLEPLLAGCEVVVRPSRREPQGIHNLLRALEIIDPWLASRCHIGGPTTHADADWQAWLAGAGTLTAQGSGAAMQAVQAQVAKAGWTGTLRLHGEMHSIAVIDASRWRARGAEIARLLANDALEVDGRGCMSLRTLLWLGLNASELPAAHRLLAHALQRAAKRWPPGASAASAAPQQHYALQTLETLRDLGAQLHLDKRADGWLASASAPHLLQTVWPGPGARALVAVSLADSSSLESILAPWRGQVSTVATTLRGKDQQALIDLLGNPRTCRPGQMQAPRPDQVHDGWAPLQGFYTVD